MFEENGELLEPILDADSLVAQEESPFEHHIETDDDVEPDWAQLRIVGVLHFLGGIGGSSWGTRSSLVVPI